MGGSRGAALASALSLATWGMPALAQVGGGSLPAAAVQAGAAPTREEVTRPEITPAPRGRSRLTVDGGVQRAPCALADLRFANVRFTLSTVYFDHLRAVSADELRPAFADLVGKTVPVSTVCEIRDAAATILRSKGYLAAVQVPPQRIENGAVHLDVLMPKLVAVRVRGQPGRSAALIEATLERLVGRDTFNTQDAERYLLLVRDLPGYDVRLSLRAADDGVPGDVIGDVSVLHQPFAIDFNLQDYGSHQVGRWGGLLRGEVDDLFGVGDRLSVGLFSTSDFSEQQVVQVGYDMHVGPEGLTLGTSSSFAWTHPDIESTVAGTRTNVRARTIVTSPTLRYPLIRAQAANLSVAAGMDLVDQRVRFNGLTLTDDDFRTVFVRLTSDGTDLASVRGENGFTAAEPRWRVSSTLEGRQGVNILNATQRCVIVGAGCANEVRPSRLDARPRAALARASTTVEFRPVPRLALVASLLGQYSTHPLLQFEEFSAGNYTIGRGYDAGAIQGDSGIGASTEARIGSLVPRTTRAVALQPYAFVDEAEVWRHGIDYAGPRRDTLISAGGGVRAAWGSHARLDLAVAVPLQHVGQVPGFAGRRGDTRVLLSITTRLLPWR